MKYLFFSFSVLFLLFFIFLFSGCNHCVQNENKDEVDMLSHLIFNEAYSQREIVVEFDSIKADKLRDMFVFIMDENPVNPEEWTDGGTVCSSAQFRELYAALLLQYGQGGLQLGAGIADHAGCRKIYHRTPRL